MSRLFINQPIASHIPSIKHDARLQAREGSACENLTLHIANTLRCETTMRSYIPRIELNLSLLCTAKEVSVHTRSPENSLLTGDHRTIQTIPIHKIRAIAVANTQTL